ncbi:MAG: S9 family peptidase [Tepidisphaeraceae bacterium]
MRIDPTQMTCGRRNARGTAVSPVRLACWLYLCTCAIFSCYGCAAGQANEPPQAKTTPDRSVLTVDRIFGKDEEFKPQDWGPARWLKNASGYCTLEDSAEHKDAKDIVRCDPASGTSEILVHATQLIPAGEDKPLKIDDYSLSEDLRRVLIFTNTKKVWRQNTRGDYWVFDRASARLQKLGGKAEPSTLMFTTFSPDGRRVAYVCHNDLYVQNIDDLAITQLTSDGSDSIVNGTSDWVYEEEFDLRKGFRWSPDGKYIAYWQFDTSGVREFTFVNNIDGNYPKLMPVKYPKVGETNSACRVGVVESTGGTTRWFKPGDDPRNHYIPQMEWSPDSTFVVFQQLNRLQNTNELVRGSISTGATSVIFTDKDDAWVEVVAKWHWLNKGKEFLWTSERDGWHHLYAVTTADGRPTLLTPGQFDVIALAGVDETDGCAYVIASPDNPTQRYLYRVPLDGSGKLTRLTPDDQPGTHSYDISKDGRWAFHTYSRFGQPPVIDLINLAVYKPMRILADNAKLRAKLAELKPCPSEFFRVDLGGGVQLDAWCIKPPDFDASKKYPLLIHVYGEPAGATVVDRWGGENHLWHCMLAQQGYLIMSIDNRGTASPRGREWRKCIYRQIGILASADQAAATRKIIETRPYVDASRIGIWGWSGGGSMSLNAIFRYPDLYRTAMAIAFISNQKLYDTVYQERYMGLPADNEAGYRDGSPITFAHQLKGNLLLVHGTGDDNCHYQNCELLVNELIKQNKQFSMMAYPNRSHSIKEGENTRRHLYGTLTRYLNVNLPVGPLPRQQ